MKTQVHSARGPVRPAVRICLFPLLLLAGLLAAHAQGLEFFIGYSENRNRLYDPAPPPNGQTNLSVAFFSGNVGPPGQPITPNDGTYYLTRSAIGQSFEGGIPRLPDFFLGQSMTNPPGSSLAHAPDIDPSQKAFYVADAQQLFASEPGFVTVIWKSVGGSPVATNYYYISSQPVARPVSIYWTEVGGTNTGAPDVDSSVGPQLVLHHNSTISSNALWLDGNQLKARSAVGSTVVEYRNRTNNAFLGVDVLEVRAYAPLSRPVANVGGFLSPSETDPATNRPVVARGLTFSPQTAYQHNRPGDPLDGSVIAVRPTAVGEEVDVCWMRRAAHGLVWPYELDRFAAQWPSNFDDIARRIYWTELEDGSPTKAPPVTIPNQAVPRVQIFYNPEVPSPAMSGTTNLWVETASRQLKATHYEGRVLLWYDNGPQPGIIGPQFVRVLDYWPDNVTEVHVGDRLQPGASPPDAVTPLVAQGLADNPAFAYQHNTAGSMLGSVFAVQRTTTDVQIEVFWQRTGLAGVIWPYEMDRYRATWPTNVPAKYQLYVRAPSPIHGPGVVLTTNYSLMPFQEPLGHASVAAEFQTTQPGWSLLKWLSGDQVSFQVVQSVWHNDADYFLLGLNPAPIGSDITDAQHRGPRPGYIHTPEGSLYDWEIYDGKTNDPPAFKTGQIIPVNRGVLEVWWANTNNGVQWWSQVKRYTNDWPQPPVLETITIATGNGSGALPASNQNYLVYSQNHPALAGFNPNDEHAFLQQTDQTVL
ncbi:MAG: hypothetical protein KJ070_17300, partial [Verrucomicrobia bacterium]|nr:hypothetical protein [Verrucomicrobiota bacterium]